MDWSSFSDWGNLASIVGFVVTLGGLAVVGWQAWGAKQAAEQTKQAAEQTRTAVANVLTFGSGNRATTLAQEIKNVLQKGQWQVAYHQCYTLRALIGDLKMTDLSTEHIQSIDEAMVSLTDIENDLDAAIRKGRDPSGTDYFNASLSSIQTTLEGMMSKAAAGQGG